MNPALQAAMKALRDYHADQKQHFTGTLRMNTEDLQQIVDDHIAAQPPADHNEGINRPIVKHGDESHLLGKRCIADDSVDPGTVELVYE